jgi:anti-sigma regulatory factor (Ser/Thr protein kinase)
MDGQELAGGDEVADDAPVGEQAPDGPAVAPETRDVEIAPVSTSGSTEPDEVDEVQLGAPVAEVASVVPERDPETPEVEIVADRRVIRLRTFPGVASSVAAARNFATQSLADLSPDARDEVRLMVSELASNAIEHVMTSFDLAIHRTSQEIRVEVTDYGAGTPTMRSVGPDTPRGRGLKIVDTLATHWGVEHRSDSTKTVWFTLMLTPALSG